MKYPLCVGCEKTYTRCRCDRPFPGAHLNGIPSRVVDLLETEGGWETVHSIADRLAAKRGSVEKAIYRLRDRGLVESRVVELAGAIPRIRPDGEPGFRVHDFGEEGHRAESRIEWRLI